jgi:hypothetical protein
VVSPTDPSQIWISSAQGCWRSGNGGIDWQAIDKGIVDPGHAWALTWHRGHLYSSDDAQIYEWVGPRWEAVSDEYHVVTLLSVDGRLSATSMGDGIWRRASNGV